MGFANGTPVHIDNDNTKPIERFASLDPVLVFDTASGNLTNPRQLPIEYSSGNPGGVAENCAAILYSIDNELQKLICTPDQQFLMKDGTMKLASKLVSGQDSLLLISGETVPIENVIVGETVSGFHTVSTSLHVPANINGNLIVANGVIVGDYALQMTPPS